MYLYGWHACIKALENKQRVVEKVFVTQKDFITKLPDLGKRNVEIVDKTTIEKLLSHDAVHQGIALRVQPLQTKPIEFLEDISSPNQCVVILDQVTDPHNVGAILRSCAAFNVQALILQERHTPKESGIMAKSACGGLDVVPRSLVVNISRTIEYLKLIGFWVIGFAEGGGTQLHQAKLNGKVALIMGAEGEGMRDNVQKKCDVILRLPTSESFSTLNVSNATAIALYETFRQQHT